MASPKSWKKFHDKTKFKGHPKLDILSRFQARYVLASNLSSLEIAKSTAEKSEAYLQLMRVTMAYSALEILEKALSARNQLHVIDENLAAEFRSAKHEVVLNELIESIHSKDNSAHYKNAIAFRDEKSDDLRPIVFAIRNLFCHGTLSASRLKLPQSKTRRNLIADLADATLQACDERFTKYVRIMK